MEARQPAATADVEEPRRRDRGGVAESRDGRDDQPGVDGAEQRVDVENHWDSVDGDLQREGEGGGGAGQREAQRELGNGDFRAHEGSDGDGQGQLDMDWIDGYVESRDGDFRC
ncbi:methyltransferase [Mycobacterium tuberculosis]|uniref:Methyltransferase n=1 Tax=Mycobacterium tuberculosis TaxID=1773 RepID=A0A0U0TCK1_MYCTX|nr:methyltransferase [Mycobacterium tuberculosis]COY98273.1 methyltransferase [Mycobacterium tuberculosis]